MLLDHSTQTVLIVFLIAATAVIIYFPLNDIFISRSVRATTAEREGNIHAARVPIGQFGDLFEILGDNFTGVSKSRYVRPATEAEMKSAEAAEEIDDAGVFAVVQGGTHVLPGTTEWNDLLVPDGYGPAAKYFRVA